jgi:hypothetical protein
VGTPNECWPEVGFEEIALDVPQARFWPTSGSPTIGQLMFKWAVANNRGEFSNAFRCRGPSCMTDKGARVALALDIAPKSRAHVRGLMRILWGYSVWAGHVPVQRNPMELVTVPGASQRMRVPRSLTTEEFQKLLATFAGARSFC